MYWLKVIGWTLTVSLGIFVYAYIWAWCFEHIWSQNKLKRVVRYIWFGLHLIVAVISIPYAWFG